jgi:hypothetical protein
LLQGKLEREFPIEGKRPLFDFIEAKPDPDALAVTLARTDYFIKQSDDDSSDYQFRAASDDEPKPPTRKPSKPAERKPPPQEKVAAQTADRKVPAQTADRRVHLQTSEGKVPTQTTERKDHLQTSEGKVRTQTSQQKAPSQPSDEGRVSPKEKGLSRIGKKTANLSTDPFAPLSSSPSSRTATPAKRPATELLNDDEPVSDWDNDKFTSAFDLQPAFRPLEDKEMSTIQDLADLAASPPPASILNSARHLPQASQSIAKRPESSMTDFEISTISATESSRYAAEIPTLKPKGSVVDVTPDVAALSNRPKKKKPARKLQLDEFDIDFSRGTTEVTDSTVKPVNHHSPRRNAADVSDFDVVAKPDSRLTFHEKPARDFYDMYELNFSDDATLQSTGPAPVRKTDEGLDASNIARRFFRKP